MRKRKMKILVTGSNGQLGMCLKDSSATDKSNEYFFYDRKELDITNHYEILDVFKLIKPDFVINCAAYTNVSDTDNNLSYAEKVNSIALKNLTDASSYFGCYLVHISSDYVFDGSKHTPYIERDKINPCNSYGITKANGEKFVLEYKKGIVIRTSWLYSEYGKNFFKTMIERIVQEKETKVINDQIGNPTYARDLSDFIVNNIINDIDLNNKCGVYHFSNEGQSSWYDLASAIEVLYCLKCKSIYKGLITPTTTIEYGDKIKRPKYSVLSKDKAKETFGVNIKHWLTSLAICVDNFIKHKN